MRRKRRKTPSFVAEFPLVTTSADERVLAVRLDAARNIYNACLGESLRRRDLMRESKAWHFARKLPAKINGEPNKARADAFRAVRDKFEFDSGSIQKFGQKCRDACWIKDHLGSHDTQTTTLRAFRAVDQYSFGKRGRPRFKRFSSFKSIESNEHTVIRYKSGPPPEVHYSGLKLPSILDPKDKHIRSISSNWARSYDEADTPVVEADLRRENDEGEIYSPLDKAAEPRPNPEQRLRAKQTLELIDRLFKDDEKAQMVLTAWQEGYEPAGVRELWGLSQNEYNTIVRRIRRRLDTSALTADRDRGGSNGQ